MADVIGFWVLEKAVAKDMQGNIVGQPYGPSPIGFISFSVTGQMASLVYDGRAEEADDGNKRAFTSYCGTYSVDLAKHEFSTRINSAADPSRIGSVQLRRFRLDGNLLTVWPPARSDGTQRILVWRKLG